MFTVIFTQRAKKEYSKLPEKDQRRVADAINVLQIQPFSGKKLDGEHEGKWSIRVWPYRIIYTIDKHTITVTVVAIGQRKDVYRRLRR